jgi:hypothetical protein
MLSPREIKAKAESKYTAFLRHKVSGEPFFPLEIPFGRPSPTAVYHTLREEVTALKQGSKEVQKYGYSITWETKQNRQYGTQTLPQRVFIADETDYLRWLGKQKEVAQFSQAIAQTLPHFPELEPWLRQYPQKILPYLPVWGELLLVCAYFRQNPRPNCYPRELPIGVHTKFVEEHEGILRLLLEAILPPTAVDNTASNFATRFGLRQPAPLIRVRLLSADHPAHTQWPTADLTFPLPSLAAQTILATSRFVIIIENLMTFLTFPAVAGGVAIWGQGFGAVSLAGVPWLADTAVLYYWGDLDTQGFEILAKLRTHYPHIRSWLMDEATLHEFAPFVVAGKPSPHELPVGSLAEEDTAVYQYLRQHNLRLEQERIPQSYIQAHLPRL